MSSQGPRSFAMKVTMDLAGYGNQFMASSVQVEFFVMSKCPDAKACEDTFLPAGVLQDLRSLVEVEFIYIGTEEAEVSGWRSAVHAWTLRVHR
eukprot:Skav226255  [mRNA]  locus=scaffold2708:78602:79765:- [translate_table: standard]